tara:strand:- start:100 stop:462 length:363 start_codon:yes stop_codon:yes gene_type:complete
MDIIKLLGNGVGNILKAGYTIGKGTANSFTEGVKESFKDPADNIVGNMEEDTSLGYKSVQEEVMEGARDNPLDYEDGELDKPIAEKYRELKKAKAESEAEFKAQHQTVQTEFDFEPGGQR